MRKKRFIGSVLAGVLAAAVFATAFTVPVLADDDDDWSDFKDGYDMDHDGDEDMDDFFLGLVIADAIAEQEEADRKEKARKQQEETERQRKEAEKQKQEAEKAKKEAEQAKQAAQKAQQDAQAQQAAAQAQQKAAQEQAEAAAAAAYYQQLLALQQSHSKAAASIITLPNGVPFDANYYAVNNPDVVKNLGTKDPKKLYNHYLTYGMKEGRLPCDPKLYKYLLSLKK